MEDHVYLCIDLKSFYASVECKDRGLDPLKANLVVADPSRGGGAICLAITPNMKAMGVKNRCRIYEIPEGLNHIVAVPRMKRYMEVSANIYKIYLKYVSKEDIHVYSIDECFLDVTKYLKLYKVDAFQMAQMLLDAVYTDTGLTATCGIGTNLFLSKVALDLYGKKAKGFIGYLDSDIFHKKTWYHEPITDIWNISTGISARLIKYNAYNLHDITQVEEHLLYKEFGINAELLIDHANGIETCLMEDIHSYKSKNNSLSTSQILFEDYDYEDAFIVFKEMVDILSLELVEKGLVTNGIMMGIGYSKDIIKPTGGSLKLNEFTQSRKKLMEYFTNLFLKTTDKNFKIRRISLGLNNVIGEEFKTVDLFTNFEEEEKETNLQKTLLKIKNKYGKNSVVKGVDLMPKATQMKRNKLIGGHNSGEYE